MVIGKGLIASAFRSFGDDPDVLIFASGVSNSSSDSKEEFKRELDLLQKHLDTQARLVYFSTVSVFDPSLKSSPYILHKQNIEALIPSRCSSWCIVRLPNVVGPTDNPNTLTNHILNRIAKGEPVDLHRNATRYLMDITDVSRTISSLISENAFPNQKVNACFSNRISMPDLLELYREVTGKNIRVNLLDKGCAYGVDNSKFLDFLKKHKLTIPADYNRSLIRKYYGEHT